VKSHTINTSLNSRLMWVEVVGHVYYSVFHCMLPLTDLQLTTEQRFWL